MILFDHFRVFETAPLLTDTASFQIGFYSKISNMYWLHKNMYWLHDHNSNGIPGRFFLKMLILAKIDNKQHVGNYSACEELTNQSPPGECLNDSFIATGN